MIEPPQQGKTPIAVQGAVVSQPSTSQPTEASVIADKLLKSIYADKCTKNKVRYNAIPIEVRNTYGPKIEDARVPSESGFQDVYKSNNCFQLRIFKAVEGGRRRYISSKSFADPKTAALVRAIMIHNGFDFETALKMIRQKTRN